MDRQMIIENLLSAASECTDEQILAVIDVMNQIIEVNREKGAKNG